MRHLSGLVLLAWLAACSRSAFTEPGLAPYMSTETVPGVSVSLIVAPRALAPGDSIEFVATARNFTKTSVQIGVQCGPSFDVVITGPHDYAVTVLSLTVGRTFTCELSPRHFAPANGSQEVTFRIAAPGRVGEYKAVAGLRRSEGLSNLSPSIAFSVR